MHPGEKRHFGNILDTIADKIVNFSGISRDGEYAEEKMLCEEIVWKKKIFLILVILSGGQDG